jgi:membrane-anchored glycerophosphoryl diester phosphodiesterase (GDPDase)
MIIVALSAFLLFVVPGIYLSVRFSYVMHAVLIDGESVIGSLKKSWRVVKGNWWRTFVLGIIVMVFMLIARFTITSLLVVVSFANVEGVEVVGDILNVVVEGVVGTWTVAAFVMAYLQLTGRQKTPEDEVLAQP